MGVFTDLVAGYMIRYEKIYNYICPSVGGNIFSDRL
jgi:hypothetical protein